MGLALRMQPERPSKNARSARIEASGPQESQESQNANLNVTNDADNHSPPQPNDQMRNNAMNSTCSTTTSAPEEDLPGTSSDNNRKRQSYLTWEQYFMGVALISAERSKDPDTQVGACIVNQDNRICGMGYNGMPNGINDDDMPWGKDSDDILDTKKFYVCHAEMNAIVNKLSADIRGCTMYVALYPCNECAKIIIQSGIKEVVYYDDKNRHEDEAKASEYLFEKAIITVRKYQQTTTNLTIGEVQRKL